jgi:hypothetical protein
MQLWQRRSLRQSCLKVGEELGGSVRKLKLKSHTEEMDYEREIDTQRLSIIFGTSNFSRAEPRCRPPNFQEPRFRVWVVPHAVAPNAPDLMVGTRRVSIYLLGCQHFLQESACSDDLEATSKMYGAAAIRASVVCMPPGNRCTGVLWGSIARVSRMRGGEF